MMTASKENAPAVGLPRGESSTTVASGVHGSQSQEPLVACNGNGWRVSSPTTMQLATGEEVLEEEVDDSGGSCGWGPFRPTALQRFRTPQWVLFWLCWAGALQGLIVNGFVNVVITTIEKRYEMSSSESGLIAGGYDIASFLCLIPISYFGGSRRKPLFIGSGVLVLALGALVFSLPHFVSGPYSFSMQSEDLCTLNATEDCSANSGVGKLNNYKYVFLLGQLLHGAGASPFYTLGCTYLDENVSTKMSSVYVGIYYTMAIIGPALGYILGGQFLKVYVDIGKDPHVLGLTAASNVWVGAWWLGFILAASIGLLVAIPLTAFPKLLPGAQKIKASKVTEMHQKLQDSEAVNSGFGTSMRDLPTSLKILLWNPTFVFLSLAGASEGMLVSGLATFLPKIIESQFSIAASSAALYVGLVTVPGAGGGTFFGGYLVKKLKLRCSGIMKVCIAFSVTCIFFGLVFILHCPNGDFAGLNRPLNTSMLGNRSHSFFADCNSDCGCSNTYDPVCGTDNVMYYSPCFAGCKKMHSTSESKVYEDCTCIEGEGRNVTVNGTFINYKASREKCSSQCGHMAVFLLLIFLCMIFTFLVSMPSLSATLRCVAESQKSFALGIQWITVRLLGTIPAPILFGYLIDQSCKHWPNSCSGKGACTVYDNYIMNRNTLILACVLKSCSCIFFTAAWFLYKPPENEMDDRTEKPNSNGCVQNANHVANGDIAGKRTTNGGV